jgi:hypothetical protein
MFIPTSASWVVNKYRMFDRVVFLKAAKIDSSQNSFMGS